MELFCSGVRFKVHVHEHHDVLTNPMIYACITGTTIPNPSLHLAQQSHPNHLPTPLSLATQRRSALLTNRNIRPPNPAPPLPLDTPVPSSLHSPHPPTPLPRHLSHSVARRAPNVFGLHHHAQRNHGAGHGAPCRQALHRTGPGELYRIWRAGLDGGHVGRLGYR